jgi:hypothetical protein
MPKEHTDHYVYCYYDPITKVPRYIGAGRMHR